MARKALLVDDEPSILVTLGLVLESKGFDVQTATSARIAKEHLSTSAFDLVITDLNMETPTSGYDVVQYAKRQPKPPATLVISGFPEVLDKWKKEGADAMLQKPADVPELLNMIKRILP
ncbi:MAG: response regulator [Acidobacteria bacterium]|nr:response regulator [Acidobacteriota bacterium]MBV9483036.1 response regulator [Acidobacteriota bacterium]